jgi:hypothetical protein
VVSVIISKAYTAYVTRLSARLKATKILKSKRQSVCADRSDAHMFTVILNTGEPIHFVITLAPACTSLLFYEGGMAGPR